MKGDHTKLLKLTFKKLNKGYNQSHSPKEKLKILGLGFEVFFRLETQ